LQQITQSLLAQGALAEQALENLEYKAQILFLAPSLLLEVDTHNGQIHQGQLEALVVRAAHREATEHKLLVLVQLIKDITQVLFRLTALQIMVDQAAVARVL
jgi:hypothetical protein